MRSSLLPEDHGTFRHLWRQEGFVTEDEDDRPEWKGLQYAADNLWTKGAES